MFFHMPAQNIVAGRWNRPKYVCKTSPGKYALPLKKKRQKEKQLCWCGTKLNSGSNIIILPVCQVPHFSFLTGYACAFSPSPCPPLIPCIVSFSTVLKAGSCSSLAEGSVCPPLAISLLFSSFCYFADLLSSTRQPSSTPFLSLFFSPLWSKGVRS